MRFAVEFHPHGRGHVDDSSNKFGSLDVRRRVVAAFELGARKIITGLEQDRLPVVVAGTELRSSIPFVGGHRLVA
jgi:hypothetical protein